MPTLSLELLREVHKLVMGILPSDRELLGIRLKVTAALVLLGVLAAGTGLAAHTEQPAARAARAAPAPPKIVKITPGPVIDCTTLVPVKPGVQAMAGLTLRQVRFSPDGKSVVTHTDYEGRLWSAETGKPLTPPIRAGFVPQCVQFRADGKAMLFAGYGCMQVLNTATGKPLFDLSDPKVLPQLRRSEKYGFGVSSAAFSPVGSFLLVGDGVFSENAMVYNAKGHLLGKCLAQPGRVRLVAIDPTGTIAASAVLLDIKAEVHLNEVGNCEPIATLQHDQEVYALAFSPDGKRLLTVSGRIKTGGKRDQGIMRLWNTRTGKPIGRPWENEDFLEHLAFGPDGKEVLAIVRGKAVTWDVATGKKSHVFAHSHPGRVEGAVWSPDGKLVLTAGGAGAADGAKGSLQVWDATTGQPACDVVKHPYHFGCLAIAPDGRTVVTGCLGKARLWKVEYASKEK
jgi:WD40 repeat protein